MFSEMSCKFIMVILTLRFPSHILSSEYLYAVIFFHKIGGVLICLLCVLFRRFEGLRLQEPEEFGG